MAPEPPRCFPIPFPTSFDQLSRSKKAVFRSRRQEIAFTGSENRPFCSRYTVFSATGSRKTSICSRQQGITVAGGHRRRAATKRGGYNTAGCGGLQGGPSSPAGCCPVRKPGLQGQSFQLGLAPSGGAEWPEVGHSRRRIRFCRNIRKTVAVLPGIYYLCPTSLNTVVLRVHKAS